VKRLYFAFLFLLLALMMAGCAAEPAEQVTSADLSAEASAEETTTTASSSETATEAATEQTTTASESAATTATTATESAAEQTTMTTETAVTDETTAHTTETTSPGPDNTVEMYSSYAFLVSYDPATGWADFDYFDMLVGDDAVQWLVDHEGYELADAQGLVDDFADSEFVLKNTNPQLRTVDLTDLPLRLMYKPDGSMISMPAEWPFDTDIVDFNAVYDLDPDLLLDSFFYFIEVENGLVKSVEQVYWP
jgi:hypothetical protein